MKRIKTIINAIWFFISVAAFAIATIYTGAFIIGGAIHGFATGYYTADDWFYWFLIGIPAINSWHNVEDGKWLWKPFGKH